MSDPGAPRFAGLTGHKLSLAISTVATTGFLLFGYDPKPFNDAFPQTRDNATQQGFVPAIYEVGCLGGAMAIIWSGDILSRRRAIMLGAFIMIIGVIIQVAVIPGHGAYAQFIIGRIVTGIGNGVNTSTIPTADFMAMLLGGVNMIVYSIFATSSWLLIERCLSMVITFACLIPGTRQAAIGAAVGLFIYIASFGPSWLPLPLLYPAEISPIKIRAKDNALSTCSNWLFNFRQPHRSLEEIGIIFAKGFPENISYATAAKQLPYLSAEEIKQMNEHNDGSNGNGGVLVVEGEKQD
ncbi:hexose carrier protein [Blastomyces gilchristii SLH14081]|uniref:Hexose carrier protein n=1 Tax=Blastomyces gilchristii (strain SLH14081) TaxID=559298 RepID=A0A179UMH1_BLAGS|nr:hexose carrier protein [Blastomyces gilchristii SLH14081]OAT09276.1 hexose carrier protein [Blastomyces gilchristii SLH14081]